MTFELKREKEERKRGDGADDIKYCQGLVPKPLHYSSVPGLFLPFSRYSYLLSSTWAEPTFLSRLFEFQKEVASPARHSLPRWATGAIQGTLVQASGREASISSPRTVSEESAEDDVGERGTALAVQCHLTQPTPVAWGPSGSTNRWLHSLSTTALDRRDS